MEFAALRFGKNIGARGRVGAATAGVLATAVLLLELVAADGDGAASPAQTVAQ